MLKKLQSDYLPAAVVFFIVICIWQMLISLLHLPDYLVPSPTVVLDTFAKNSTALIRNSAVTVLESVLGFVAANVSAFLLALMLAEWRSAEKAVYPFAIALKTAPIVALAPLLVVWFGTGVVSKVITAAIVCFFPMLVNAAKGLREVDPDAVDLMRSMGADRLVILRKLRIPNSLPYVFSALKISTSLSIVGAIVGEFVGAQEGLGYVVVVSSYHLETAMMACAVICAACAGLMLFGAVVLAEKTFAPWSIDPVDAQ